MRDYYKKIFYRDSNIGEIYFGYLVNLKKYTYYKIKKGFKMLKNGEKIMATRYPIILVHGIVIKDLFFIKSFGQIDKVLRENNFKVYKSKVDSFGTTCNNAHILKAEILKIIRENKCEKVNIIAHSKGGLDAKYMIEHLDMACYVASLTTLCTPHKGSIIATKLLELPKVILHLIAFWLNFLYRLFGDKKPDALAVCQELASINSIEEETFNIGKDIYCQSYSTKQKRARDDFIMGIPLIFSHYFVKEDSDGVVTTNSAMFGNYKGLAFNESVSHSEIIDFMVRKKKKAKIYAFYLNLCKDLANRNL